MKARHSSNWAGFRRAFFIVAFLLCSLYFHLQAQSGRWIVHDSIPNYHYFDMKCADSLHCMAVGSLGTQEFDIRKTTDGGKTWTNALVDSGGIGWPHPLPGFIRHISYPTPDVCLVGGDNGIILMTHDGGSTWRKDTLGSLNVRDVAMSTATIGMVGLGADTMMVTIDGGKSWHQSQLPSADKPLGIYKICSIAPGSFCVLCVNGNTILVLRTDDTGSTWRMTTGRPSSTYISFVDSLHGWTAGDIPIHPNTDVSRIQVARTIDGGITWDSLVDSEFGKFSYEVHALAFRDTLNGIISDYADQVLRTRDGGKTWTVDSTDYLYVSGGFSAVAFLTPTHYMAVTGDGKIFFYDEPPASVPTNISELSTATHLSPNPIGPGDIPSLSLSLPHGGRLDIAMIDMLGREVSHETSRMVEPGEITVDLTAIKALSAGSYIVRVSLDGQTLCAPRAVVR